METHLSILSLSCLVFWVLLRKSLSMSIVSSVLPTLSKTMNSCQGNTEQKEKCWKYHNTWLQTMLQSHSNKNSMVLAQKEICRPVEQDRGPGYESTQLPLPNFRQRCQKHMMEKRQPLQQLLLEKVVIFLQKTETRPMPVTLY
jgi:hypothetical protein